jgi:hypothetical protein
MKDKMWNELLKVLKKSKEKKLMQEDWDTWWGWNNTRQRTIKKGAKGVRIIMETPMRKFSRGCPLTETNKKGKVVPMIRMSKFKKSFFNIDQTELK